MHNPVPDLATHAEAEVDAAGRVTLTVTWPATVITTQAFTLGPRLYAQITGTRLPLACRRCGTLFRPTRSTAVYCSKHCRWAYAQQEYRDRRHPARAPQGEQDD